MKRLATEERERERRKEVGTGESLRSQLATVPVMRSSNYVFGEGGRRERGSSSRYAGAALMEEN